MSNGQTVYGISGLSYGFQGTPYKMLSRAHLILANYFILINDHVMLFFYSWKYY